MFVEPMGHEMTPKAAELELSQFRNIHAVLTYQRLSVSSIEPALSLTFRLLRFNRCAPNLVILCGLLIVHLKVYDAHTGEIGSFPARFLIGSGHEKNRAQVGTP